MQFFVKYKLVTYFVDLCYSYVVIWFLIIGKDFFSLRVYGSMPILFRGYPNEKGIIESRYNYKRELYDVSLSHP